VKRKLVNAGPVKYSSGKTVYDQDHGEVQVHVHALAVAHGAQSAISTLAFADDAFVAAQSAADAIGMPRRLGGQTEPGARAGVERTYVRPRVLETIAQTAAADADRRRNKSRAALAKQAFRL
jgi:hypothetical protein